MERQARPGRGLFSWKQFLALAAVAAGAYFLVSLGGLVMTAHRLNQQGEALRSEIRELREENARLQDEVDWLGQEAAVERIARTELGWTYPGEIQVVVDVEPVSNVVLPQPSRPTVDSAPNWRQWLDLVLQGDTSN